MIRRLVPAVLAALILTGCGYTFQGANNRTPDGIHRLTIPTVVNPTVYTDLTYTLTNYLIQRFNQSQVLIVTVHDNSEAVLSVAVVSVQVEGAARALSNQASASRRITVVVSGSLKRRDNNRVLWEVTQLVGRRSFTVADDQSILEANLGRALDNVARELAEKIHDNVVEDF